MRSVDIDRSDRSRPDRSRVRHDRLVDSERPGDVRLAQPLVAAERFGRSGRHDVAHRGIVVRGASPALHASSRAVDATRDAPAIAASRRVNRRGRPDADPLAAMTTRLIPRWRSGWPLDARRRASRPVSRLRAGRRADLRDCLPALDARLERPAGVPIGLPVGRAGSAAPAGVVRAVRAASSDAPCTS